MCVYTHNDNDKANTGNFSTGESTERVTGVL